MDGSGDITLSAVSSIATVGQAGWDAVANPPSRPYNPFVSFDFLDALEASGCVTPQTGWAPTHLLAHNGDGALVGAAPAYLKSHSYGEFVFDHAWADAYHRAGGRYYPKLQCASPFTPATGPRLLVSPAVADPATVEAALARGLQALAVRYKASSAHITFPTEGEWDRLGEAGWLQRTDQQFHFHNPGYRDFDDFLDALASRKRKNLRKERATAQAGLEIDRLTGADLKTKHWDAFFDFYEDTGARKWGSPYLNRDAFEEFHDRLADKIVLVLAREGDRPIAGALNFVGGEALFGRYWGRAEERPCLHFELCYYQAIDIALERGLKRVEAGAQGAHKLARGYAPARTYSAHWLADPAFSDAVADYLDHEREAVAEDIALLDGHTPFKKGD